MAGMMDLDANNTNIFHLSNFLSKQWCDVLDISFNITAAIAKERVPPGAPANTFRYDTDRFGVEMANKIVIATNKKCVDYLKRVCPQVTPAMITDWGDNALTSMTEMFDWVSAPAYAKLFQASDRDQLDTLVPDIVRGIYGAGFHKAACKLMAQEVVENAGTIPFTYRVAERVLDCGFKYNVISDLNRIDRDTPWIERLERATRQEGGCPVEILESNEIIFTTRPGEWRVLLERAFANIFGCMGSVWKGHHAFGLSNANFMNYIHSITNYGGALNDLGGDRQLFDAVEESVARSKESQEMKIKNGAIFSMFFKRKHDVVPEEVKERRMENYIQGLRLLEWKVSKFVEKGATEERHWCPIKNAPAIYKALRNAIILDKVKDKDAYDWIATFKGSFNKDDWEAKKIDSRDFWPVNYGDIYDGVMSTPVSVWKWFIVEFPRSLRKKWNGHT